MLISENTSKIHNQLLQDRKNADRENATHVMDQYDEMTPFSQILKGHLETTVIDETPWSVTIKKDNPRTQTYHLILPVLRNIVDFLKNAPTDHKKRNYFQNLCHPEHSR